MSTYFNESTNRISTNVLAKSSHFNDLRDELGAGFDMLPEPDDLSNGSVLYGTDSGIINAYVVTMPVSQSKYTTGMLISFTPAHENTGASTINVDSLGIKNIKDSTGGELSSGSLIEETPILLIYNGTFFSPISTSIDASSAATNATKAAASFESFDERYLGAKASDPTTDNSGNTLLEGALYWKTTATTGMRVWDGSAWGEAYTAMSLAGDASGNIDMNGHKLLSIAEEYTTVTSSSNTLAIDCSLGNSFKHTMTENTTISFSNVPPSGVFGVTLKIVQDAVGGAYTLTFPTGTKFAYSSAPLLSSGANEVDIFVAYLENGSTIPDIYVAGQNFGAP